jgi:hypothetical protein
LKKKIKKSRDSHVPNKKMSKRSRVNGEKKNNNLPQLPVEIWHHIQSFSPVTVALLLVTSWWQPRNIAETQLRRWLEEEYQERGGDRFFPQLLGDKAAFSLTIDLSSYGSWKLGKMMAIRGDSTPPTLQLYRDLCQLNAMSYRHQSKWSGEELSPPIGQCVLLIERKNAPTLLAGYENFRSLLHAARFDAKTPAIEISSYFHHHYDKKDVDIVSLSDVIYTKRSGAAIVQQPLVEIGRTYRYLLLHTILPLPALVAVLSRAPSFHAAQRDAALLRVINWIRRSRGVEEL